MAEYKNINEATTALGYGTIISHADLLHAAGVTTTGDNVWLPIMYDPDNNWFNMYGDKKAVKDDLIIQIPNSDYAFNAWKVGILLADIAHVIVRTKTVRDTVDYNEVGDYCPVLFDESKLITINAKVGSSVASGKKMKIGKLHWVTGFASTEIEAADKFDLLVGKTWKVLRGI